VSVFRTLGGGSWIVIPSLPSWVHYRLMGPSFEALWDVFLYVSPHTCTLCPIFLICLNVGFFICKFSSMSFHFDQKRRYFFCLFPGALPVKCLHLVILITSLSRLCIPIFSQPPAALGCHTNKAWLKFVTGVPRNAKTQAASSRRFELDPSS